MEFHTLVDSNKHVSYVHVQANVLKWFSIKYTNMTDAVDIKLEIALWYFSNVTYIFIH